MTTGISSLPIQSSPVRQASPSRTSANDGTPHRSAESGTLSPQLSAPINPPPVVLPPVQSGSRIVSESQRIRSIVKAYQEKTTLVSKTDISFSDSELVDAWDKITTALDHFDDASKRRVARDQFSPFLGIQNFALELFKVRGILSGDLSALDQNDSLAVSYTDRFGVWEANVFPESGTGIALINDKLLILKDGHPAANWKGVSNEQWYFFQG